MYKFLSCGRYQPKGAFLPEFYVHFGGFLNFTSHLVDVFIRSRLSVENSCLGSDNCDTVDFSLSFRLNINLIVNTMNFCA